LLAAFNFPSCARVQFELVAQRFGSEAAEITNGHALCARTVADLQSNIKK
jgi:hypothetical protein